MLDHSPLLTRRSFMVAGAWTAAVFACGAGSLLTGCSGGSAQAPVAPVEPEPYVSPYNWDNLVWDGEKLAYYEDNQVRSRWGIDVSEHQGDAIDWAQVAAAGVQFVFARIGNRGATEGALGADEFFYQNAVRAHEAGLEVSAYFFSQALTEDEAREEAAFAIENLRETEQAGVTFATVAYDHEAVEIEGARANNLSDEQFTANALAFCETIKQAGYQPLIYGNQNDLLRLTAEARAVYPLWLAEYGVPSPTAPFDFAIWQYTNAGDVAGIETPVDLNLWLEPK